MLSTDLRVGVFQYWKQIHNIIFCKGRVFPAVKIILSQQDLDTFIRQEEMLQVIYYVLLFFNLITNETQYLILKL